MSALVVNRLTKSFGGLRVTKGVDLAVEPGERRLIIGANGAGKTGGRGPERPPRNAARPKALLS